MDETIKLRRDDSSFALSNVIVDDDYARVLSFQLTSNVHRYPFFEFESARRRDGVHTSARVDAGEVNCYIHPTLIPFHR